MELDYGLYRLLNSYSFNQRVRSGLGTAAAAAKKHILREEAFGLLELSFFVGEGVNATAVLLKEAEFLKNGILFADGFPGAGEVGDGTSAEGLHLVGDGPFLLVGVFGRIGAEELGAGEFGILGANGKGTAAFIGAREIHNAAADLGAGIGGDSGGRVDIGFGEGYFSTVGFGIGATISTLV